MKWIIIKEYLKKQVCWYIEWSKPDPKNSSAREVHEAWQEYFRKRTANDKSDAGTGVLVRRIEQDGEGK